MGLGARERGSYSLAAQEWGSSSPVHGSATSDANAIPLNPDAKPYLGVAVLLCYPPEIPT